MLPCGIGPTEARTGLCNSTCRSRLWPEAGITGPRAQKGPQDVTEQDRLWCPCSSASCLQLKKPLPQIRALQQSRLLLESQGKDTPPPQEVQEAPAGISNRTDTGCVSVSTNDHKPGHLKQQAFTCSRFQRPEVWKQVCTGLHSLQRLEGRVLPASSAPGIVCKPGVLGLQATFFPSLSLSSCGLLQGHCHWI